MEEAHEKLKSSLKLKEREWDIETYETSKQIRELDHMCERLKQDKVKLKKQLKVKSGLFKQLEENYQMLRNRHRVSEVLRNVLFVVRYRCCKKSWIMRLHSQKMLKTDWSVVKN